MSLKQTYPKFKKTKENYDTRLTKKKKKPHLFARVTRLLQI